MNLPAAPLPHKRKIPKDTNLAELHLWLMHNCQGDFFWDVLDMYGMMQEVFFEKESDTTMFDLRWV